MTQSFHTRGGFRGPSSFRPVAAAGIGQLRTTARSSSYEQTPTKEQLREELAQAARNTAGGRMESET